MNKEFICMEETISDTQKKIKTWVSSGYEINIIFQSIVIKQDITYMVTSLWRSK